MPKLLACCLESALIPAFQGLGNTSEGLNVINPINRLASLVCGNAVGGELFQFRCGGGILTASGSGATRSLGGSFAVGVSAVVPLLEVGRLGLKNPLENRPLS